MAFAKYNENGEVVSPKKVVIDCQQAIEDGEEVRVEQSHKDEVDINVIVKRHGTELIAKTQALQNLVYDDVVGNDFQETMNMMLKAQETFSSIPSKIRREFDNDPAKFMDFVHNPDNKDRMIEMGLAKAPEPEPAPIKLR